MVETVLFDLDGTILDTNELIIATFMEVFKDAVPKLSREQIIRHMGKPLREQLRIFSGRERVDDLEEAYRTFNYAHHDEYVKEFPHVKEVVSQLYADGVKLGVVTTKIRRTTLKGLAFCGLSPFFRTIITIEDVENAKPHPEPVLKAMEALGADPGSTLMVGDSPADIEAANRAGALSAAVAWSLKGTEVLERYHPRFILHDMRDLLNMAGSAEGRG